MSDLSNQLLASPSEASSIFGLDGSSPTRQKHLFYVRFVRSVTDSSDDWNSNLSFVVHSVDRPSVTPQVEEINQYNKKRLITTGVKYNPINCSFYDTADGAANNMWVQYAQYYFGDFSQANTSYVDDMLNSTMTDSGSGFGFQIKQSNASSSLSSSVSSSSMNTQYFFDHIEVIQVWGGEFVALHLLNPRITSFAPDNLDYSASEVNLVNITIDYEAIYYPNDGKPQAISSDSSVSSAFAEQFNGDVLDIDGNSRSTNFTSGTSIGGIVNSVASLLSGNVSASNLISLASAVANLGETDSSIGGSLNRYGNYSFGSLASLIGSAGTSVNQSGFSLSDGSALIGSSGDPSIANSSLLYDIGNLTNASRDYSIGSSFNSVNDISSTIASGIGLASSIDSNAASDQYNSRGGISLNDTALAAINSQTDGTWQLGARSIQTAQPNSLMINGDLVLLAGQTVEL